MGNTIITCPECGERLAQILGEVGTRRRMKFQDGVRARVEKNGLGEDLGWARCPKCKTETRVDPSYLPGSGA